MEKTTVYLVCQNMMLSSSLEGVIRQVGMQPHLVTNSDDLINLCQQADSESWVVLDLACGFVNGELTSSVISTLGSSSKVAAFGPHVQSHLFQEVQNAGCEFVFPNSKIVSELRNLLTS